jgi:hypothetical protein
MVGRHPTQRAAWEATSPASYNLAEPYYSGRSPSSQTPSPSVRMNSHAAATNLAATAEKVAPVTNRGGPCYSPRRGRVA